MIIMIVAVVRQYFNNHIDDNILHKVHTESRIVRGVILIAITAEGSCAL